MEFLNQDLKNIIHTSRAFTHSTEGWILESKQGRAIFQFPNDLEAPFINLHAKKRGGNGLLCVNNKHIIVSSKVSQVINLAFQQKIEITSTKDTVGDIVIIGFSIDDIGGEDVSSNWKALIARCGNYKGLKLINNRLYASEGSFIESADMIDIIETNPSNVFIKDNTLVFKASCEITKLKLNDNIKNIEIKKPQPFVHREDIMPKVQEAPQYTINIKVNTTLPENITKESQVFDYSTLIIFDSKISGLNASLYSKNKLVKNHSSNGRSYVSIKPGGSMNIPLGIVEPESNYMLIVTAKKLSGQGKINIGLGIGQDLNLKALNIDSINYDKTISVCCPARKNPTDSPTLSVNMDTSSSGEVLIERLILVKDLPYVARSHLLNKIPTTGIRQLELVLSNSSIRSMTREAAILTAENSNYQLELNCAVEALTYSGRQWVKKTAPFVKGFKFIDKTGQVQNVQKTQGEPDLVLGALGKIKIAKHLFIEHFDPKVQIKDPDKDILLACGQISTNSRPNCIVLSDLLSKKINYVHKPWFVPEANIDTKNYFIHIERNEEITKRLINSWTNTLTPLVIIGSNLDTPSFIRKISANLPYSQFINLILNAKMVIDLDKDPCKSGLLELLKQVGIPLVSNNVLYSKNNYVAWDTSTEDYNLTQITSQVFERSSVLWSKELYFEELKSFIGL